jgi:hypothetical protein
VRPNDNAYALGSLFRHAFKTLPRSPDIARQPDTLSWFPPQNSVSAEFAVIAPVRSVALLHGVEVQRRVERQSGLQATGSALSARSAQQNEPGRDGTSTPRLCKWDARRPATCLAGATFCVQTTHFGSKDFHVQRSFPATAAAWESQCIQGVFAFSCGHVDPCGRSPRPVVVVCLSVAIRATTWGQIIGRLA